MTELVGRARDVLARLGLSSKLQAQHELASELDAADRELAAAKTQVPLVNRVAFFTEDVKGLSRLSARRRELAAALEKAEGEAKAAMAQADAEFPLLAVVGDIVRVHRRARRRLFRDVVGDASSAERREIVRTLEALSRRVIDLWAPGFDAEAIREALSIDPARAEASRPLAAPATDERLGFAPIRMDELLPHLASLLATDEYRSARAALVAEEADLEAVRAEVAAMRRNRRLWQRADPRAEQSAQSYLAREQAEAWHASERIAHLFHRALASFPPLGIWLALETLIALHQGRALPAESALYLDGVVRSIPAFAYRAIGIDALASLRSATDTAFLGLFSLIEGHAEGARRGQRERERGGSPFRVAALARDGDDATEGNVTALMRLYDEAGVRELLGRARVHALLAGTATRARRNAEARIGFLDRAAIWSDSKAELDAAAAVRRADWHRAAMLTAVDQIQRTIWAPGQQFHALRVRDAIMRYQLAVGSLSTAAGAVSAAWHCQVFGEEHAYASLQALEAEIGSRWGNHPLTYGLAHTRQALSVVRGVQTRSTTEYGTVYGCAVFGREVALAAAQQWARQAFATIGEMPPDGLLLCHYVEQLGARTENS